MSGAGQSLQQLQPKKGERCRQACDDGDHASARRRVRSIGPTRQTGDVLCLHAANIFGGTQGWTPEWTPGLLPECNMRCGRRRRAPAQVAALLLGRTPDLRPRILASDGFLQRRASNRTR
ncbi:hypothetical protein AOX55_00005583 (plasmid) [Sinorhizobium fredii CCBAU 25509]|nr:hypothetical protein AOX55_00005583 [Sinorhizobium fredii CCBAU 25509]